MRIGPHRVAVNPLQFAASADGWFDFASTPPLVAQLEAVHASGFEYIHAAPPADLDPAAYARLLTEAGLAPGPGYLAIDVDDHGEVSPAERRRVIIEGERLAASGCDTVFVAPELDLDHERFRHPARGVGSSPSRTARLAESFGEIALDLLAVGVTSALHPHVGSVVETGDEFRTVLAGAGDALRFGPDTGHLAWAGIDPVATADEFRDRIPAIHLKDYRLAIRDQALAGDLDYAGPVRAGLWTEPGLGDAPLASLLELLANPTWIVVEVDRASDGDPIGSLARCAAWVRAQAALRGS